MSSRLFLRPVVCMASAWTSFSLQMPFTPKAQPIVQAPPVKSGTSSMEFPETFQCRNGIEGVHAGVESSLARRVVPAVPELSRWDCWYSAPFTLRNGHVHTIAASQLRATAGVEYNRQLLSTPDGGTLALDLLVAADVSGSDESIRPATSHATEIADKTRFVEQLPPRDTSRPFLLLVSGLGGGSQDTYVRSMAVNAASRGWQVGVINMRGCGGSPVTSPRFFSAFRGATDDVRLAVQWVREEWFGTASSSHKSMANEGGHFEGHVAVLGWSNGGSIVNNLLAEQATTHATSGDLTSTPPSSSKPLPWRVDAGAALACPLDMVANSNNLQRPFHRAVYDRSIAKSLATKVGSARALYEDENGQPKPVPKWEGLSSSRESDSSSSAAASAAPATFVADVVGASQATTIRAIDDFVTAPCFGFNSVDEYYAHASSAQRLHSVQVPLLVLSAYDDPIAVGSAIPLNAGKHARKDMTSAGAVIQGNPDHVVVAVTAQGGHLGWCDSSNPWGGPAWTERASLGFLEASLGLPVGAAAPGAGCSMKKGLCT